MATRHEEGGSRLWRGMRSLLFGDEGEQTLRDEIEEAIDEAEDSRPVAGDLTPTERQMLRNLLHFGEQTAGDICVTRGDIIAVPRHISFEDLVAAFADAVRDRFCEAFGREPVAVEPARLEEAVPQLALGAGSGVAVR